MTNFPLDGPEAYTGAVSAIIRGYADHVLQSLMKPSAFTGLINLSAPPIEMPVQYGVGPDLTPGKIFVLPKTNAPLDKVFFMNDRFLDASIGEYDVLAPTEADDIDDDEGVAEAGSSGEPPGCGGDVGRIV